MWKLAALAVVAVGISCEATAQTCPLTAETPQRVASTGRTISVLHRPDRTQLFFVSHMNWNNDGAPFTYHPEEWRRVPACNAGGDSRPAPRSANTLCNGVTVRMENGRTLLGYMTQDEARQAGLSEQQRRREATRRCQQLLCYVRRAQDAAWHPSDFTVTWSAIATQPARDERGAFRRPCVQTAGAYQGYFISTTSYQDASRDACDARRYLDPFALPAVVRPGNSTFAPIELPGSAGRRSMEGGIAVVIDLRTERVHYAVIGDSGPAREAGEVTPYLHWQMRDVPADRRDPWQRGSRLDGPFAYVFLPETRLAAFPSLEDIRSAGERAFTQWGGLPAVRACAQGARR